MEEVAATSSNVNNNAGTVGDEVKELAEASKALSAYAEEMKKRAASIEKEAETNKNDALSRPAIHIKYSEIAGCL